MDRLDSTLDRFDRLLARAEALLPATPREPDWTATAWRWRVPRGTGRGQLDAVRHASGIALADIRNVDRQKALIVQNTRQFVAGAPANNVLLTGARGTGKSSLVKAVLNEFAPAGLRLIEVDKADLHDLHDIVDLVAHRPERFIVFCDDLSFEDGEAGYKALKVALDGSIAAQTDNVVIYATSNRRHLLPERMSDNDGYRHTDDGELHPGEVVEEKISLSERFGLWVSFHGFRQGDYLDIVRHWLGQLGSDYSPEVEREALQFALGRGSRSGRVAWQYARDRAGRDRLALTDALAASAAERAL
ncbi:ATP-binding protein [Derxia lacustris]|uniref:ATP-binding protein n=1 Tax=Derxia lacustris TaxID=764842 RepID=UPI000A16F858|nr:ATP-binding protein [Derxia lacustris]